MKLNAEKETHNLELRDMDQQKEKVLAKKREKEEIKGKTDSLQNQINTLDKKIKSKRDKLLKLKESQVRIEETKQHEIQSISQKIRNNQVKLKEQMFFLQNLIPKSFIQQLGNSQVVPNGKENHIGLSGHSIHNLRKPLSIHTYEMEDSYLCPYPLKFSKKKDQSGYPDLNEMMKDGKNY